LSFLGFLPFPLVIPWGG